MRIIGLTGGIGSGKSTVARAFEGCGAYVVDADKISKRVLDKDRPAYNEVVHKFGASILDADENIDRKALASIVFSDEDKLGILNKITHKFIFEDMRHKIDDCPNDTELIVLDVPLLFADDFTIAYDKSVVVVSELENRIARVIERDGTTAEAVTARIKSQMSDDEMKKRADYVIENDCGLDELYKKVVSLYRALILG